VAFESRDGVLARSSLQLIRRLRGAGVRTPEDVATLFGLHALAAIGRLPHLPGPGFSGGRDLDALDAFEGLADALRARADSGVRTLLVTSARPEEGKSTTAAHLATVLARRGHGVVLVDADLRWSSLRTTGAAGLSSGLSGLLLNRLQDPQAALVPMGDRKLRFLPAGSLPSHPHQLLSQPRLPEIIDSLRAKAACVILDSPSLLEADDAGLLAPHVDGVLLVVQAGRTRAHDVNSALRVLSRAGKRPLGVVLNRADRSAARARQTAPHARTSRTSLARSPGPPAPLPSHDLDDADRLRRRLEALHNLRLVRPDEDTAEP
jgi:capsular exopolysaccharide synthesis family protein